MSIVSIKVCLTILRTLDILGLKQKIFFNSSWKKKHSMTNTSLCAFPEFKTNEKTPACNSCLSIKNVRQFLKKNTLPIHRLENSCFFHFKNGFLTLIRLGFLMVVFSGGSIWPPLPYFMKNVSNLNITWHNCQTIYFKSVESEKYWHPLLWADVISFFVTRKCQKIQKIHENRWK